MSRCFFEWRRLADDRWWKKQLLFREREIELLEKLCGGFRNRPFVVLRKRRLRRILQNWLVQAVRLRRKRLRLAKAVRAFRNRQIFAAWTTWVEYANVCISSLAQLPCSCVFFESRCSQLTGLFHIEPILFNIFYCLSDNRPVVWTLCELNRWYIQLKCMFLMFITYVCCRSEADGISLGGLGTACDFVAQLKS
jgi:hypothetical protein